MWDIEVDQQTHRTSTELEIRQNLRDVERQHFFHCFEFDDDAVFDKKIDSISSLDLDALVNHGQADLVLKMQSIKRKLIVQTCAVGTFQQACAKSRVNFDCALDNALSDVFVKQPVVPPRPPCPPWWRVKTDLDKQSMDRF